MVGVLRERMSWYKGIFDCQNSEDVGATGVLWREEKDDTQHPMMYRTVPTTKKYQYVSNFVAEKQLCPKP